MNEKGVAMYERLMVAEELIAHARARYGVSDQTIMDALVASAPDASHPEEEEDPYLSELARYVAALGGHLKLLAVFPEEATVVFGEGEEPNVA
jgi:hypothetical protein